jgi:hypothetical protein
VARAILVVETAAVSPDKWPELTSTRAMIADLPAAQAASSGSVEPPQSACCAATHGPLSPIQPSKAPSDAPATAALPASVGTPSTAASGGVLTFSPAASMRGTWQSLYPIGRKVPSVIVLPNLAPPG